MLPGEGSWGAVTGTLRSPASGLRAGSALGSPRTLGSWVGLWLPALCSPPEAASCVPQAQPWTSHIRTLFSVLNYEQVQQPSLLGASVLGLGDVHQEALEAAADPALTADFKTILD